VKPFAGGQQERQKQTIDNQVMRRAVQETLTAMPQSATRTKFVSRKGNRFDEA